MCTTCGCPSTEEHSHNHDHGHGHGHDGHHHHHHHEADNGEVSKKISVETDILDRNNRLAAGNRALFASRGVFTLNLVSSPGSGKTTILERTLRELAGTV